MVSAAGDFPFLAESARRFVAILAARPAFEGDEGERGSALIEHIDYTTAGLKSRVDEIDHQFHSASSDLERAEAFKKLRLVAGYAHFMRKALPWVEDASDPPLELGALYFIDELSERMLGEVADIVPTRSSEYSTEQQPFRPLFPDLNISPDPAARRPIILNFPALEAKSFPLLPLFGHEIGHTLVSKRGLLKTAISKSRADPKFTVALEASKAALRQVPNITRYRAELVIEERLEHWTTELLCDQLAMQYLGPSYLLAFGAYVLPLNWNAPGPNHPPTTFRIAHLLKWVSDAPWETLLQKRMPVSFEWLKQVAQSTEGHEPALARLFDALNLAQPILAAVVSDSLSENVYPPEAYFDLSPHLEEQLQHEVLPVQHPVTREAFDPRAILISGWLSLYDEAVKSSEEGETAATLCRALSMTESNAFFTKALELSRVLQVWRETQ